MQYLKILLYVEYTKYFESKESEWILNYTSKNLPVPEDNTILTFKEWVIRQDEITEKQFNR